MELTEDFWHFKCACKLDILPERRYTHKILQALADRHTTVERIDKDRWSVAGPSEGLLVCSETPLLRMILTLSEAVMQLN